MFTYIVAAFLIAQIPTSTPRISTPSAETATTPRVRQLLEFQKRSEEVRKTREARKAEFQNRLSLIKDTRKQQIVSQIQDRVEVINTNAVTHFNLVLNRISSLLDKVELRMQSRKASGVDTSSVEVAITSAREKIANAQSKVNTQAGKVYSVTITSESTVGQTVKTLIQQLRSDLKTVRESVIEAREAVVHVIRTLGALDGEQPENE